MGNRAVIVSEKNWYSNGVGVYLHWNGGRDSVEAFLEYCKLRGFRPFDSEDGYGLARFAQVVSNYLSPGGLSIGVGRISGLDTHGDNGVYIIKGWEIVGRKNFEGAEQMQYDREEMMLDIDAAQPAECQIGDYFRAEPIEDISTVSIGDEILHMEWDGLKRSKVVGIGRNIIVNGRGVYGVPFFGDYGNDGDHEHNPNNYMMYDNEYSYRRYRRVVKEDLPDFSEECEFDKEDENEEHVG